MNGAQPVVISAAVEGSLDETVAQRLIRTVGARPGPIYGRKGKPFLKQHASGYANAARFSPWLILVDLDRTFDCAPDLPREWNVDHAGFLCFRVAVREVEAWLLADRGRIARFLGIRKGQVPADPEGLLEPKRTLIDLARHSTRRALRYDLVPRPGSGRTVGPAYTSQLGEFVRTQWDPEAAAGTSESLSRALRCLRELTERAATGRLG